MNKGYAGGIAALSIFVFGGICAFTGMGLIAFMKGSDIFGLGDGRTLGFLFLCVGACLSIMGVLIMRLVRNRF
ncbi:hypothetical protein [Geomonas sp.]|uniref:hypothetical protein n=1 Tax=Geomonas sp. TaxID=2651584 RepID=UPI002B46A4FA|nr:hypothetical protein [Geomonas sp.]HJV34929.1 hypothetical protein [Geomonas sp.]